MLTLTEQITQLHDEIDIYARVKAHSFAKTIMSMFAGSNVHTVIIQAASDETKGKGMVSIVTEKLATGDFIDEHGLIHYRKEDGTFDLASKGNEAIKSFLEYGIEWNAVTDIVTEITSQIPDLMFVFDFLDDNVEGLYITEDGFWIAQVAPIDLSDNAPQTF